MSSPLFICFPLVLCALRVLAQGTNEVDSLPIITRHPQSYVVAVLQVVTLRCEADGDNLPILFSHNGTLINENDPAYSLATDSLTINRVVGNLQGEYVCLARNRVGNRTFTVASAPALIQLQVFEVTLLSASPSSPHNVTTTVGQPAILNCARSINTLPPPSYNWEVFTPIRRRINSDDHAIIGINGSLYLQNPTLAQNNMIFFCSVSSGGRVEEGYIRLIVQASSSTAPPPVILSHPMDIAVAVGTRQAEFECITGGSPILPVVWTASSPGPFFTTLEGGYRVAAFDQQSPSSGLQPTSRGQITCTVSSIGDFTASLDFIEPPTIRSTLPGTTQVITYGDPLSLRCDSDSRSVSWSWFHNGLRLDRFTGPLLNISSLGEEDTGSYQCYVVNEAGIAHGSTYVQVQTIGAEIQQDLPPDTIVFRNQPANLDCIATGAPPPSYQWLKDNIPLSDPFEINPTNGTLRISVAADVHNGQYRCRATNRIGERVIGLDETSTTLTVITATRFTQPPVPEPTLDIQLDTEDTLFCEVSSDSGSTLQFSWTKDGEQLVLDGPRVTYVDPLLTRNGSIRITRVTNEDAGLYTCTVMTTYNGIAAPTIQTTPTQVMVTASPVSPMITELTSPSSTSVQVIWSITSNLNRIQSFSIEIRPASSAEMDGWIVTQRNANAVTLIVIENLTPFTRYMVRVNASYINGEETSSDVKEVVTMEDLPGDSPKDVTTSAIAGSDTNLEIKWQPPTQPNGVITDYIISYRLEDNVSSNQTTRVGSNATTFILKDLEKGMNYIVRIAAVNSIGVGPFSDISMAVTGSAGLREPQGPFYQTVWFIVLIIVVVVVVIVTLVLFVLIIKYKRSHRRSTGKYHVRPQSGYFGGGGPGVSDMTDDVASDYLKRSTELNAFGSPTNSEALDAMLERETIATTLTDHSSVPFPSLRGTPQLPNGARFMGIGAPGYINPPSFQEAVSRSRKGSRSSRPHSGASNTEPLDWSASHSSKSGLVPGGYDDPFERKHFGGEVPGPNSSFSVQTFSDGDSEMTDATEYSHLAGAGPFPRSYHHLQVQSHQNATLV